MHADFNTVHSRVTSHIHTHTPLNSNCTFILFFGWNTHFQMLMNQIKYASQCLTRTKIRAYASSIEFIVFGGERFMYLMYLHLISILIDYIFFYFALVLSGQCTPLPDNSLFVALSLFGSIICRDTIPYVYLRYFHSQFRVLCIISHNIISVSRAK